jgi:hypothetical protein
VLEFLLGPILEFLFGLLFELLNEVVFKAVGRTLRRAFGDRTVERVSMGAALVVVCGIAAALGWWRGEQVDGLGWGFWVAVAVGAVAIVLAVVRIWRPAGPAPESWRVLLWWPAARCIWFAAVNLAFVVAYASAGDPPRLR